MIKKELFILLFFVTSIYCSLNLRVMRLKMSNDPGSGMDGGLFGDSWFEMEICSNQEDCCRTGKLNTEDNNWELGEQNFFVGRQLGMCENQNLTNSYPVTIKVQHHGTDGGKIEWINLRGPLRRQDSVHCQVNQKLDNDEYITVSCNYKENSDHKFGCNGNQNFCNIPFNHFTFPGTHNAGTGQWDHPSFPCYYKNHDLNVREQLDLGIRFLDFDITYSTSDINCNGLETGHGPGGSFLYQCFGTVEELLQQISSWMDENPQEVAIAHFGSLNNFDESYPRLQELMERLFPNNDKLNTEFQREGTWPTLGKAVSTNKRLFIMTRLPIDVVKNSTFPSKKGFIPVVKIKDSRFDMPKPSLPEGTISMISTYGSGNLGDNCNEVIGNADSHCKRLEADFVKVSTYGRASLTQCLETNARICNPRIPDILKTCKLYKPIVNVVFTDYPNYLASSLYTLPEITDQENLLKIVT